MGALSEEMKRVVLEQKLGFVATVCSDGTPNLSPKGTTTVWDDDHLVFADIRSPHTVANLRQNPHVEINVVDPIVRKGWRFKGRAELLEDGAGTRTGWHSCTSAGTTRRRSACGRSSSYGSSGPPSSSRRPTTRGRPRTRSPLAGRSTSPSCAE